MMGIDLSAGLLNLAHIVCPSARFHEHCYCPVEAFGFSQSIVAQTCPASQVFPIGARRDQSSVLLFRFFAVACSHQDTSVMFVTVGDRAWSMVAGAHSLPLGEDISGPRKEKVIRIGSL